MFPRHPVPPATRPAIIVVTLPYLDWLEEVLAGKLAAKPIGEPIALRAHVRLTSDHGLLIPTLAATVKVVSRWFGQSPPKLYAQGGAEQGHVSVLATFAGGQTALVGSELIRDAETPLTSEASVRLLLVGNRGTMEFADTPGADTLPVDLAVSSDPQTQTLVRAIEQSLKEGGPVG